MNINFNRFRAQLRCESILNCNTLDQWKLANFKNLQLSGAQASLLSNDLREDAKDFYFKGLLSLFESLRSIENKLFSWATVKIYYSLYYFLRSSMALNGVGLIRQKSLFCIKAFEGEIPISKTNKKYSSDHSGTINYFIDFFSSDLLLSQSIDSVNVYEWIMNKREQVNYRERTFNEPNYSDFWEYIAIQIKRGNFETLISEYIKDRYILCFQEEHAILAAPLKRALLTRDQMINEGINLNLTDEKLKVLADLLSFNNKEIEGLII